MFSSRWKYRLNIFMFLLDFRLKTNAFFVTLNNYRFLCVRTRLKVNSAHTRLCLQINIRRNMSDRFLINESLSVSPWTRTNVHVSVCPSCQPSCFLMTSSSSSSAPRLLRSISRLVAEQRVHLCDEGRSQLSQNLPETNVLKVSRFDSPFGQKYVDSCTCMW